MPAPLLFAVPAVAAITDLAPRLVAEVIERGGDVNDGASIARRTVEGTLKAEKLMNDMRRNAEAIRLYKKEL